MCSTCEPPEDAAEEAKVGSKILRVDREGTYYLLLELFPPFELRQDEHEPSIINVVNGEGVVVGCLLRDGAWELKGELILAK